EPVAVAVYDVAEHGKININDFVVVQGSGPIGILAAYMAKRLGARSVLLTGISASEYCRFDVAKKLGADYIVNVQKENLLDKVMELTEGRGADCVIETSGAPSSIALCTDMLKKNGRLIGMGIPADKMVQFPWKDAVLKSLEIYFSMSTSYTAWDKALCLLQADSDKLQNLITWTGVLDDWERVFNSLVAEKDVKAVFMFE
ncbi:MAG: zinc-binding dehydrogenase, partial [Clostridia bacterium]|nr:zinc-binding dehydrogenase [Clostridia bacterium]